MKLRFSLLALLTALTTTTPSPSYSAIKITTHTKVLGMPRKPVSSSNIASIGYDAASKTLEIEFRDGAVYQYYGVPASVYSGLMSASSHGTYLADNVKDAGYRYRRVQ